MAKELDLHAAIDRHVTEVLSGVSAFHENLKSCGNADQRAEMTSTRLVATAIGIRAELSGIRLALVEIASRLPSKE
jgi:hypothetical protein